MKKCVKTLKPVLYNESDYTFGDLLGHFESNEKLIKTFPNQPTLTVSEHNQMETSSMNYDQVEFDKSSMASVSIMASTNPVEERLHHSELDENTTRKIGFSLVCLNVNFLNNQALESSFTCPI